MHITGEPDGSPVKVGVAITGGSRLTFDLAQGLTFLRRLDNGLVPQGRRSRRPYLSLSDW